MLSVWRKRLAPFLVMLENLILPKRWKENYNSFIQITWKLSKFWLCRSGVSSLRPRGQSWPGKDSSLAHLTGLGNMYKGIHFGFGELWGQISFIHSSSISFSCRKTEMHCGHCASFSPVKCCLNWQKGEFHWSNPHKTKAGCMWPMM